MPTKVASVPLPSDPSIRRSYLSPDELLNYPAGDEVKTVGDIWSYCAKKHGDHTACSYRTVTDIVEERKKIVDDNGQEREKLWKYFSLSNPIPLTYNDLDHLVTDLTRALLSLSLTRPTQPIAERPRVSIYADTSYRWQAMAQAFARLGHTITTSYTTLGEEGLFQSLDEPEVELVFCGEEQLGMLSRVIGQAGRVKWVVYDGGEHVDQTALGAIREKVQARQGRVLSFEELRALGKANPVEDTGLAPSEEDIFCIMYTSGSTGKPKGVILSHKNIISSLAGSTRLWGKAARPYQDVLLAYLPLAHILEQFLEYTFNLLGVQLAYANVKTLIDDSVRGCKGDLATFRPTLMGGVPAVFEMISKGMMQKVNAAGVVVSTLFHAAVAAKSTMPWPVGAIIDATLLKRAKSATGGRLRVTVVGGGAISEQTQSFLSTVLAPMHQGYGMTETCGMATITTPDFHGLGSVGVLGPSCELKLSDCPELGYLASSDPPQGEIWLRGHNVFKGYFKQPELTQESFTPDGWFKTGDIGQWDADGTLRIIDRVKNLIKLGNGEYIALDRIEAAYKSCDVVLRLCIAVPMGADRPVAIVYPHEGHLRAHLKSSGIASADQSPAAWVRDKDVHKVVLERMLKTAKAHGLKREEMVKAVILTPEDWTPDNGMLTPAMKLARPVISKTYADEIKRASAK